MLGSSFLLLKKKWAVAHKLAFLIKEELLSEDVASEMKSWAHTGFNVYAAEPIAGEDARARLFLARYLKKAPLSLARLRIDESGGVPVVVCRKELDDGESTEREFSPLEFLAELQQHVPDR